MIEIVIMSIVSLLVTIVALAIFIKKRKWSKTKMRYVFALLSAFFVFPTFAPVAMTAVIMPNITLLGLSVYSGDFLGLLFFYLEALPLFIPSYSVTFVIMLGISQMIFFEHKGK